MYWVFCCFLRRCGERGIGRSLLHEPVAFGVKPPFAGTHRVVVRINEDDEQPCTSSIADGLLLTITIGDLNTQIRSLYRGVSNGTTPFDFDSLVTFADNDTMYVRVVSRDNDDCDVFFLRIRLMHANTTEIRSTTMTTEAVASTSAAQQQSMTSTTKTTMEIGTLSTTTIGEKPTTTTTPTSTTTTTTTSTSQSSLLTSTLSSTTTIFNQQQQSSSLSLPILIGSIVGGIFCLLILFAIAFFLYRRRNNNTTTTTTTTKRDSDQNTVALGKQQTPLLIVSTL
jgi:hypothetical protein